MCSWDRANGRSGDGIATLNISALERATGLKRSTIHYYIREGLLPRPAKLAASRSLYCETHVELLRRIAELKRAGHSLDEIRDLTRDLAEVNEPEGDPAAREYERLHAEMIRIATGEFIAGGYEATHVATIIKKVGTTPHVFYSHFASKQQLLAECFLSLVEMDLELVEPKLADTADLGRRLLARLASDFALHALGAEGANLIRSDGEQTSEVRKLLEETYSKIAAPIRADLEAMRPVGSGPRGVPTELLAYSLLGAFDNTQLRASWDNKYTRADLFRAHLWLWLAIRAAISGRVDIEAEVAGYEDLIQEAAASRPEPPPELDR